MAPGPAGDPWRQKNSLQLARLPGDWYKRGERRQLTGKLCSPRVCRRFQEREANFEAGSGAEVAWVGAGAAEQEKSWELSGGLGMERSLS